MRTKSLDGMSSRFLRYKPPCSVRTHLVVGEEGHEIEQARQLQVLPAGLLVAAALPALLALPLQQTPKTQLSRVCRGFRPVRPRIWELPAGRMDVTQPAGCFSIEQFRLQHVKSAHEPLYTKNIEPAAISVQRLIQRLDGP